MIEVKCIVVGINSLGAPDLYPVVVRCRQASIEGDWHLWIACNSAKRAGYNEDPLVTFDELDGAAKDLLPLFNWDTAKREVEGFI